MPALLTYPLIEVITPKLHGTVGHDADTVGPVASHHALEAFLAPDLAEGFADAHLPFEGRDDGPLGSREGELWLGRGWWCPWRRWVFEVGVDVNGAAPRDRMTWAFIGPGAWLSGCLCLAGYLRGWIRGRPVLSEGVVYPVRYATKARELNCSALLCDRLAPAPPSRLRGRGTPRNPDPDSSRHVTLSDDTVLKYGINHIAGLKNRKEREENMECKNKKI
ncbi:hypothetical protein KC330_g3 [Hortaea werneckii]|nr:hypothetical protein KC330_g3 [Hortaea werneckii]